MYQQLHKKDNNMKVIVVDNEEKALEKTVKMITKAIPDAETDSFVESSAAWKSCQNNNYDFAFLNTEIDDMSGIKFAQKLRKLQPQSNVVFVTEESESALEAFKLHASGYLMKPVRAKDIEDESANRRYAPQESGCNIEAKTFGQFDILVNGKSIHFKRAKSKEVIAYLIDRRGSGVTKRDLASVIFEDSLYTANVQDYLGKILKELDNTLKAENVSELLVKKHNYYAVNTSMIKCDLYDYLDKDCKNSPQFFGEYMNQYSWAEMTLANLYFSEENKSQGGSRY